MLPKWQFFQRLEDMCPAKHLGNIGERLAISGEIVYLVSIDLAF
jgi:hypothetical protein